jgi:hypothetical protein
MTWAIAFAVAGAAIVAFFTWANRSTARIHARFQRKDVEQALLELTSPDPGYLDNWELFLAWPIDDPYLESVRTRCLKIVEECSEANGDVSATGIDQVTALLRELRERA